MAKIYSDVTNMGLRDLFKKKEEPAAVGLPATLGATAKGMFVAMDKVPDGVVSAGVLEPCCGVEPEEGKEYDPITGRSASWLTRFMLSASRRAVWRF